MFDAGWLVPGNPPEFGGRNATLLEQFVHQEELGRRRIYQSFNPQGLSIIVPSILAFGTEEQKQRWARPILRAEITAALGMSEPDAGSDLAGLRTRAVLDGDRFIVNGQKVWTSGAHDADVILAFVRTDPDAPKHKGISVLLIPTDTPGVTRRPFGSIQGKDEIDFNEVFFDDVVVPAENLIGELHQGWRVATGSLGHERAMLWLGLRRAPRRPRRAGRPRAARPRAGRRWLRARLVRAARHRQPGPVGARPAHAGQGAEGHGPVRAVDPEAARAARRSSGPPSTCSRPSAPTASTRRPAAPPVEPLNLDVWTDSWFDLYLRTFSMTIAGGTSQIQRNIVAEHVLGLPR